MANKALMLFFAANAAINAAAFPATQGPPELMGDLQKTQFTLGLAASRARPAKLSGNTPLAWFAMS